MSSRTKSPLVKKVETTESDVKLTLKEIKDIYRQLRRINSYIHKFERLSNILLPLAGLTSGTQLRTGGLGITTGRALEIGKGQTALDTGKVIAKGGIGKALGSLSVGQVMFITSLVLQLVTIAINEYEKWRLIEEERNRQRLKADLVRELKDSEDFKRAMSVRNQRARSAMP